SGPHCSRSSARASKLGTNHTRTFKPGPARPERSRHVHRIRPQLPAVLDPSRALTRAGVAAEGKVLLDAVAIERTLSRIAHEVIERNPDLDEVALVGIQTRGVPIAQRIRRLVAERTGTELAIGAVDITFYR